MVNGRDDEKSAEEFEKAFAKIVHPKAAYSLNFDERPIIKWIARAP